MSGRNAVDEKIIRCRELWDRYCNRPTKTNLQGVFDHLEAMRGFGVSDSVKKERARCIRVANKEAERIEFDPSRSRNPSGPDWQPDWHPGIGEARILWNRYYESPSEENLKTMLRHLEAMKYSGIESVRREYKRLAPAVHKEAKRRWIM